MTTLAEESRNMDCPVVIADRINTLKSHREDVFAAMKTIGIRVVIMWEMSSADAITRIKQRKFGHRTIGPEANVAMIVGRTAKEFEALSTDEIDKYSIRKVVVIRDPMSQSRADIVKTILMELCDLSELAPLELHRITQDDIDRAVLKTTKREESLYQENELAFFKTMKRTNRTDVREGRFELTFPRYGETLANVARDFGSDEMIRKNEFHVTLLYINRKLSKLINTPVDTDHSNPAKYQEFDVSDLKMAIEAYQSMSAVDIDVRLEYVAWNESVMAAKVSIPNPKVRYFDVVPHISLAKTPQAEFREANTLIHRCDEIRSLGMPQGTHDISWRDLPADSRIIGRLKFTKHGSQ